MNQWLANLRNKSQAEKIRLVWTVVGISAVLLVIVWVATARYSSRPNKTDTGFLETMGQGLRDVKNNFKK